MVTQRRKRLVVRDQLTPKEVDERFAAMRAKRETELGSAKFARFTAWLRRLAAGKR